MKKTFLGLFGLLSIMGATSANAADAATFVPASSNLSMNLDLNQSSAAPILSISYKNTGGKGSLSPLISGAGFSILSNRCLSVAQNRSCVVSVIMSSKVAGSHSAVLSAPNSTDVSITSSVTAKSVAQSTSFSLSPATQNLTFATGEKSKIVTLSVKNTGNVAATPSLSISANTSGLSLLLNRCVGGVRPGSSCLVTYSIKNAIGSNTVSETLGSSANIIVADPVFQESSRTDTSCGGTFCYNSDMGWLGRTTDKFFGQDSVGGQMQFQLFNTDGSSNLVTSFQGQGIGIHFHSHADASCVNGYDVTAVRDDGGPMTQVSSKLIRIYWNSVNPNGVNNDGQDQVGMIHFTCTAPVSPYDLHSAAWAPKDSAATHQLAGYWPLSSDASDKLNITNGQVNGYVTFDGTAASFYGNGYIDLGNTAQFQYAYGQTFTVSLWFLAYDSSVAQTWFSHGDNSYAIYNQGGYPNFARAMQLNAGYGPGVGLDFGSYQWVNLVAIIKPGYSVAFYKNGVLSTDGVHTFDYAGRYYQGQGFDYIRNLRIGMSDSEGYYVNGKISEVGVFTGTLSDAEISSIYTNQKAKFGL